MALGATPQRGTRVKATAGSSKQPTKQQQTEHTKAATATGNGTNKLRSDRARRRREEAVRRLVADVSRTTTSDTETDHDWLVASAVAIAIEKGLDKDLHAELVEEERANSARIGQVCHDHSDAFLESVGMVVQLGAPSEDLAHTLSEANEELQTNTAGIMKDAATHLEHSKQADARARTLHGMVTACHNVAGLLERARQQAALGRPQTALTAVDDARQSLAAPLSSHLFVAGGANVHADAYKSLLSRPLAPSIHNSDNGGDVSNNNDDKKIKTKTSAPLTLEETPFGARAMTVLPKIENEVLIGARRGLNRWFLAMRSGGDGAKAGRAVLRRCANSMAVGPGQLGLGGAVPKSYTMRSKTADNWIARVDQNGRVARAVRLGYWFERDASKETERLESQCGPGVERRAEAFAAAFGWYRCWNEHDSLLVDVTNTDLVGGGRGGMGGGSLHGSVHGGNLDRSSHGSMGGSRHGRSRGGTLGFRAKENATRSSSMGRREVSAGVVKASQKHDKGNKQEKSHSAWATLLTPSVLFEDAPTR